MTDLRNLYRRWQISHYERQRQHLDEAQQRSQAVLGAYGVRDGSAAGTTDSWRHAA